MLLTNFSSYLHDWNDDTDEVCVDYYSGRHQNDYRSCNEYYFGPHNALTELSYNFTQYWHSHFDDTNPFIELKINSPEAKEIVSVQVTDRQDCCFERFKDVEVLVGNDTNIDNLTSCGKQTYTGSSSRYEYFCPNGTLSQYIIIRKENDNEPFHVNHVTAFINDC